MFGFRKKDDGIQESLMKEHEEYLKKQKALTREILPDASDEIHQVEKIHELRENDAENNDKQEAIEKYKLPKELEDLGIKIQGEKLPFVVKVFLILFFGPTILSTVIPGIIALIIGLLSILI